MFLYLWIFIGDIYKCKDKAPNNNTLSVRCKAKSDPDMDEKYLDLPNDYWVDTCYVTEKDKDVT